MFVVFEGIDGSGKTTLSRLLVQFLNSRGVKAVWTKEPYAEETKRLLTWGVLNPWGETFLLLSDRNRHVREFVKPKLEEGYAVVSDRYYFSTLAYQGYGKGLPLRTLKSLNSKVIEGLEPDLVFLLDVEPRRALERIDKSRTSRVESFEEEKLLERVRRGYLKLAKGRENVFVLNAEKSPYELLGEILRVLEKKLKGKI